MLKRLTWPFSWHVGYASSFFLGGDVNLSRPRVFKLASRMAQGETYSLVVPVLANICNGLNKITCSSKPGSNASIFLFIIYTDG